MTLLPCSLFRTASRSRTRRRASSRTSSLSRTALRSRTHLRAIPRIGALLLAAALTLSGCSSKSDSAPPDADSSASSSSVTPTESTPAPGEWTLEDLKVGATVPKEDLERLFPAWEKPTPPPTLTENSEQGAKDAAVYYEAMAEYAIQTGDVGVINEIDSGLCQNCGALRDLIKRGEHVKFFRTQPTFEATSIVPDPEDYPVYEVGVGSDVAMVVRLTAAGGTIESVKTDVVADRFGTVGLHNQRWAPAFLTLSEASWTNE